MTCFGFRGDFILVLSVMVWEELLLIFTFGPVLFSLGFLVSIVFGSLISVAFVIRWSLVTFPLSNLLSPLFPFPPIIVPFGVVSDVHFLLVFWVLFCLLFVGLVFGCGSVFRPGHLCCLSKSGALMQVCHALASVPL